MACWSGNVLKHILCGCYVRFLVMAAPVRLHFLPLSKEANELGARHDLSVYFSSAHPGRIILMIILPTALQKCTTAISFSVSGGHTTRHRLRGRLSKSTEPRKVVLGLSLAMCSPPCVLCFQNLSFDINIPHTSTMSW